LLALLLIAALSAPAFACFRGQPGQQKSCKKMDCCQHASVPVPAQSMKKCDCRADDSTQQVPIVTPHHVQFVVLAMVAIVAPPSRLSDSVISASASSSPPGPSASSVLRL
jgi:hypothetical protein